MNKEQIAIGDEIKFKFDASNGMAKNNPDYQIDLTGNVYRIEDNYCIAKCDNGWLELTVPYESIIK